MERRAQEIAEALRMQLASVSVDARTVAANPRSTVGSPTALPSPDRRAFEELSGLVSDPARFIREATLGEGGMGLVELATQVSLGRSVALKRLRPELLGDGYVDALLMEARLTGQLEHPNILPIYDLTLDAVLGPVLVMKRIDGETWAALLARPDAVVARGETDVLGFHLRVLAQVCNAVHFAHDRGVVHRDIKPENVMLGHFGEVYVVDWGLAMPPGFAPQLAGTPAYMAPEMLGGGDVSERTDVYLLGAVLFEIISGSPPHTGASVEALIASVLLSQPAVPAEAPDELAAVVRACLSVAPASRPATALALRQRIDQFMEHRGSVALTERAEAITTELEQKISRNEDRKSVHSAFTEARFAFVEALRGWPGHGRAVEGVAHLLRVMIAYELAHGDASAASTLLADLTDADAELRLRVAQAEQNAANEALRLTDLARLGQEHDPRIGRRSRQIFGVAIGAFWTLAPLGIVVVPALRGLSETLGSIWVLSVGIVLFFLVALATRLYLSRLNRRLWLAALFAMVVQLTGLVVALRTGTPEAAVVFAQFGYWLLVSGLLAITLEERLSVAAAGYFVALLCTARWPAYRHWFASGANFILTLNMAAIWSRVGTERAAARDAARAARRP